MTEFLLVKVFSMSLAKRSFYQKPRKDIWKLFRNYKKQGAEGVILGCTEIPILIKQSDCDIPVFDTMYLHSKMAVEFANQ